MKETIRVFVNGSPVLVYRGMKVKHALIARDQTIYKACVDGRAVVEDSNGFSIGLEGSLTEGATIYVRFREGETK
jgi:hypothetical protein